jgi:ABC-type transport system involved in multi-copper enzyme maturation permease subunit
VVEHFSLAALSIFGALIAVFIGTGLVYKEIDKRTIYTILSKPVMRWQFLVGKYLGLMGVLAVALFGMFLASLLFTAYAAMQANWPEWTKQVNWGWFALAAFLAYFEVMVVVAVAMFFGSVSSPVLSAFFTFAIYLVGQVSYSINFMLTKFAPVEKSVAAQTGEYLTDFASSTYWLLKPVSTLIYYILPDLQHFQLRNQVVFGPAPQSAQVVLSVVYGIGYSAAVICLTVFVFNRKRF